MTPWTPPPTTGSNSFIFTKRFVKNVSEVGAWGGSMVCQGTVCAPCQALGGCPLLPSKPTNGKFRICYWIHYYVNLPIWCGGQECDNPITIKTENTKPLNIAFHMRRFLKLFLQLLFHHLMRCIK